MLEALLLYLFIGAVVGVLAGLLGIGGGLVLVPMLYFAFTMQGVDPSVMMKLTLGTSMAAIIFTALSSVRAHQERGAVRWNVVLKMTPGIIIGTFYGARLASLMPTFLLKFIFIGFLFYVAVQMFRDKESEGGLCLPGTLGLFAVGLGIGGFSSFMGIGGGTLSVPFMAWCQLPFHTVIGTSAAIAIPIALAGTAGYVVGGWENELRPFFSLGFVHVPALLSIVAASVLTAPLGAKLAHSLPVNLLKKVFAILLLFAAIRMLLWLF